MLAGDEQYPGGAAAREAEISGLAADPPKAVAALRVATEELEGAWATADWSGTARVRVGEPVPTASLAWSRWREVEVHAVDLDLGYRPGDWPAPFLERLLAELRAWPSLPDVDDVRGSDADLAAWLIGRSDGTGRSGRMPPVPPWR
jgi:maleylpyruvate isomerase